MAVDSVAVVQALGRLDVERLRRYRENLAFFEGRQWAGQARRRERRLVFNYTRAVIEKAAAFTLRGVKSVIAAGDGAVGGGTAVRGGGRAAGAAARRRAGGVRGCRRAAGGGYGWRRRATAAPSGGRAVDGGDVRDVRGRPAR